MSVTPVSILNHSVIRCIRCLLYSIYFAGLHPIQLNNYHGHGFLMNNRSDKPRQDLHATGSSNYQGRRSFMVNPFDNPRQALHDTAFYHNIPAHVGDSRKYLKKKTNLLVRHLNYFHSFSCITAHHPMRQPETSNYSGPALMTTPRQSSHETAATLNHNSQWHHDDYRK